MMAASACPHASMAVWGVGGGQYSSLSGATSTIETPWNGLRHETTGYPSLTFPSLVILSNATVQREGLFALSSAWS
jgi:hypothetical protein